MTSSLASLRRVGGLVVAMGHLGRILGWGGASRMPREARRSHLKTLAWAWSSTHPTRRPPFPRRGLCRLSSTGAATTSGMTTPLYNGTVEGDNASPAQLQAADPSITSQWSIEDWRNSPELNPTLEFPTMVVPAQLVHVLVRDPTLQPYLASTWWSERNHVQRRLRIVRDDVDSVPSADISAPDSTSSSSNKLLLLHPSVVRDPARKVEWESAFRAVAANHSESAATITLGPAVPVRLRPKDFTVGHVLSQLLPAHITAPPTSFETVGHVAHLNLPDSIMPYRHLVGQVLLECLSTSGIETVICKTDSVAGPYRTYEFEIVAGTPTTVVEHAEHGVHLQFDVQKVYWSSRLSQERKRLADLFQPGQVIADAFCGVGALCLQAAKRGCVVLANDWNPDAVEALNENAKRNRVKLASVECGDAYEFLMDLGLRGEGALPDHVVMNYPLEAPRFLGALRWWPTGRRKHDSPMSCPRLHVYTFARADGQRSAEDVAIDAIASHLVVSTTPNADGGGDLRRGSELNEFGCKVHAHYVRDVAPGKKVFCVSFTATPKLLRYMQGDFS